MSSERDNPVKEDEDVAEIKKALATGTNKQLVPGSVSSGRQASLTRRNIALTLYMQFHLLPATV